jgi:ectoine hydroxylase-related dioxygenase (phytanoyl-CoA dioxygenase family)
MPLDLLNTKRWRPLDDGNLTFKACWTPLFFLKGALQCEAKEDEAIPVLLNAGDCTFHDGRTIHYSRGNETSFRRHALILNFRPKKMIQVERQNGFDHLGEREVRNKKAVN